MRRQVRNAVVRLGGSLVARLRDLRMQRRVRAGFRLVDEPALERAYADALKELLEELPPSELGDYLEFGVYHGASMACMDRALRTLGLSHVRLIGFDSFEGLPDEARDEPGHAWEPRQFRSDMRFTQSWLVEQGVDPSRFTLVKGWFADTTSPARLTSLGIRRAGLVMVDCDLQSSAATALRAVGPLIDRVAILFFDDWHSNDMAARGLGERRAFEDWLRDEPSLVAESRPDLAYSPTSAAFTVRRRATS